MKTACLSHSLTEHSACTWIFLEPQPCMNSKLSRERKGINEVLVVRQSPLKQSRNDKEFSAGLVKRSLMGQGWEGWGDPGSKLGRMLREAGGTSVNSQCCCLCLGDGEISHGPRLEQIWLLHHPGPAQACRSVSLLCHMGQFSVNPLHLQAGALPAKQTQTFSN